MGGGAHLLGLHTPLLRHLVKGCLELRLPLLREVHLAVGSYRRGGRCCLFRHLPGSGVWDVSTSKLRRAGYDAGYDGQAATAGASHKFGVI